MTDMYSIPGAEGYFVNREGTRVVGPSGGDLTMRPNETNGRLRVKVRNKHRYVHELVALTFHGKRPVGKEILHADDKFLNNHADNLSYDTREKNVRDAIENGVHVSVWQKNKTHCPQGHEYSEENTHIYTKKNGVVGRQCKTCSRERTKAWREKNPTHGRDYMRAKRAQDS